MDLPPKICPECGAEYVPTYLVCADCDVALEEPNQDPRPALQRQMPPATELALVAAGVPREVERIALVLQGSGISSRVDTHPDGGRVAVYVHPEDAGLAAQLVRDFVFPREGDEVGSLSPDAEVEGCPACGAVVSDSDVACADCGLAFVASDDPG